MTAAIVFFDEDCAFCRWSADRLRAWDRRGRLRFATIQGAEGDRRLGHMDAETRLRSWHVVTPDGAVRSAGAALPPTLRLLPGGRPLAAVAAISPTATEGAYRWVARHRGRLARIVGQRACAVNPSRNPGP